ncbi:MAG TPA: FAD-binding oxidoreductase [Geminicoccus sp.]|jgi:glycine/D-amino acid oxidase-like deaminating enzyme|uniref:NAD(P)/FAD-dependent oxidoreductase n=1 Tax=Geminicoccus sp. TaxID=2024832 RepID=UPI002E37AE17|nr:FAD-binding oxidoreductase [Geminicoccus sp.]HEX2524860.1 FAD-binding oxidoreductase [Geminicoccus sp.]
MAVSRVVVVGGGVMGCAVAAGLRRLDREREVVVIERDPTYRQASSALSASSIRRQFSQPVNMAIGAFGYAFLKDARRHLAVDGEMPDIGLLDRGYLFLAGAGAVEIMREVHALQRAHDVQVALLEPNALAARFPWLEVSDVALASLGLAEEGWFDGYGLLQAFRKRAIADGVRFVHGEVTGFEREGQRVARARLGDGSEVEGGEFLVAAGPWSGRIGSMLDLDIPVRGRRRSVFVLDTPDPLPGCPLVIDPSGFWLRPEGRYYLAGMSPLADEDDPDDLPLEVDHALFEEKLWPALAARVPSLERLKVTGSWAGYYEMNTVDHNGLVGRWPGMDNLWAATGFSGHGIQQAPAVGQCLAELMTYGGFRSLDLSALAPARLHDRRPLLEKAVI